MFGQSFTPAGVAALSELRQEHVVSILDRLVDRQVLGFNDDRLSSERGQYHFLQALLRTTAYGTLSRKDRKNRHLAAARHLQEAWGEAAPELAEVLAAHFLDAAAADPDAADAPKIRAAACQTLADAGERALSLALGAEAQHAFDRAAELAAEDSQRATMLHRAGQAALLSGDLDAAHERLSAAIELFEALGDTARAARSSVAIGQTLYAQDRLSEGIDVVRQAVAALPAGRAETAAAQAALAQLLAQSADFDGALEAADQALTVGEPLREWETVVRAMNALSHVRERHGRVEESMALRERALKLALEHDLTVEALRTYNNVGDSYLQSERYAEAREWAQTGVALAKARGDRFFEELLNIMVLTASVGLGDWDAAAELEAASLVSSELLALGSLPSLARLQAGRGEFDRLAVTLRDAEAIETTNVEYGSAAVVARAIALNAFERPAEALEAGLPVAVSGVETVNEDRREAYIEAGQAAIALGDETTVERLISSVAELPPSMRSPCSAPARRDSPVYWPNAAVTCAQPRSGSVPPSGTYARSGRSSSWRRSWCNRRRCCAPAIATRRPRPRWRKRRPSSSASAPPPGCCALERRGRRSPRDPVSGLRGGASPRRSFLCAVRHPPSPRVSELRGGVRARQPVLPCLRDGAEPRVGGHGAGLVRRSRFDPGCVGVGAAFGVGVVCGSGRVHDLV